MTGRFVRAAGRALAWGAAIGTGAYATYVATTWLRYGHAKAAADAAADPLLDRFMPEFEVAERHHVRVAARPQTTFDIACQADPDDSPIVRAIFRGRQLVLGAHPDDAPRPRGIVALTRSLGWGVLAEVPGHEIVMGAVTQPWNADVQFHGIPPDGFAAFDVPGYAKIAWTLRADAAGDGGTILRTETRVATTDAAAREKFRRYWAVFAPGIVVIRRVLLARVKAQAERPVPVAVLQER